MEGSAKPTRYPSATLIEKQHIELPCLDRNCKPVKFSPQISLNTGNTSKAGILCNDRRNFLASKKVDQIPFLNSTQYVFYYDKRTIIVDTFYFFEELL